MTPKEKASKLVVTFMSYTCDCYYYEDAKACALIVVDEIIKIELLVESVDDYYLKYWQEVKQEIEKIA